MAQALAAEGRAETLLRTLRLAVGQGRWFRLEETQRLAVLGVRPQPETSQPLFLAAVDLQAAADYLERLLDEARLERQWEICCPSCQRACVQADEASKDEAFSAWLGYLADCPHCQAEFNCLAQHIHPVYRAADGYYQLEPVVRRRPSALAERSA